MKSGKTVIFPIIVLTVLLIIAMIVGLVYGLANHNNSVFDYENVRQIINEGNKPAIDDTYKFNGIEEFGYSGDAQIEVLDEKIYSIWFITELLKDEKAKENIEYAVDCFIKSYSKELDFEYLKSPNILQFCDDETFKNRPEDNYEALIKRYVLFEYSYRDKDGVLWIVQVYSPKEESLRAILIKQIDESEYEGYEPQINMQRSTANE